MNDDTLFKSYYIRNSNEIEICKLAAMRNFVSPTHSVSSSSTSSNSSFQTQNLHKIDKTNEINMINTGVVKNLRKIFNQKNSSLSPITTSNHKSNILNNNNNKKSFENFFELKKCRSVLIENMDENNNDIKFNKLEKAKSNNCLNEIANSLKQDEECFENVDIKARINQFTRRNSLVKDTKNIVKRKSSRSLKYNKNDINEYKGSLSYLDKIDDANELNQSTQQNASLDDSSDITAFSDDFISLDNSTTNSNKDSTSSCTNLNSSQDSKTSSVSSSSKFEENFQKILTAFNDLKEDNFFIEKLLNEVKIKVEEASIAFQKNLDDYVNTSFSNLEEETNINKENVQPFVFQSNVSDKIVHNQIKLIRHKF